MKNKISSESGAFTEKFKTTGSKTTGSKISGKKMSGSKASDKEKKGSRRCFRRTVKKTDSQFCSPCGTQKPAGSKMSGKKMSGSKKKGFWRCSCGTVNKTEDLFCSACGAQKPAVSPTSMENGWQKLKASPSFSGLVLMLASLLIYFVVLLIYEPASFLSISTYRSFTNLFKNFAPLILITMGQALLMLMGIIDISIGIQLSFANVLAVMLPEWTGMPVAVAWLLTICASILLATLNGIIVSYLRIPPLLAGYAMIYIVKGINLAIRPKPGGSVPAVINRFYDKLWGGFLPTGVIVLTICYLGWVCLKKTPLINHVYAVGGNERNTFAAGVNGARTKVKIYAVVGLLTGIAGLCYTAAYTTGNPIAGEAYGLQTISACILGGISLAGGWGTMSCALYGIGFQLLIQMTIPKVFSMIPGQFNTYWHNLVSDTIILIGLVTTIFAVKAQRTTLLRGIKKQLTGGDRK